MDASGLMDVIAAKCVEMARYSAFYRQAGDPRAREYVARYVLLSALLRSVDVANQCLQAQLSGDTATTPPASMSGLITEVGGQLTVYLYTHSADADAAKVLFERKHAALIDRGGSSCHRVFVDNRALTDRIFAADALPIAQALNGEWNGNYSVSLRDNPTGACAAADLFEEENAEDLRRGNGSMGIHAVVLPLDWWHQQRRSRQRPDLQD